MHVNSIGKFFNTLWYSVISVTRTCFCGWITFVKYYLLQTDMWQRFDIIFLAFGILFVLLPSTTYGFTFCSQLEEHSGN